MSYGSTERRGPAIKFCGLTRAADAATAGELGARYLGAIFAGGPREVAPSRAAQLFSAGRAAAALTWLAVPRCVGVFAAQGAGEIRDIVEAATLDVVQLHADPTPAHVRDVRSATGAEVWATLRVRGTKLPVGAAELFDVADAVVLDAHVAGALGGTGVGLEWERIADEVASLRGATPLVLAGGLRPSNVAAALGAVAPSVVDVSSGVEQAPGIKDHHLMRDFVQATLVAAAPGRASRDFPS